MNEESEKEQEGSGQLPEDAPEETSEDVDAGALGGSADVSGPVADEVIAPDSELAEALREKDQFRALAQRAQADFVNFRSRVEAENAEIRRRSARSLVIKVLEVVDSVDAALESVADSVVDQSFIDGVEAIGRSLESFLSGEGVEKFDSVGEKFDPRLHEALMRTQSEDHPSDTVIRVMRAGYKMGDDVLRPAFVEVAASPASDEAEGDGAGGQEPE